MDKNAVIGIGIVAIAAMEVSAMIFLGQDGVLLSASVATVSGIVTRLYSCREVNNGRDKFSIRDNCRSDLATT